MSVLIDSYGWIEYFSDGLLSTKYAKFIESATPTSSITPAIVLYEVYKKIKKINGESAGLKAIAYIMKNTTIISIDRKISLNAAEVSLRTGLSMADSIIKAVAENMNAKIITSDKHFKNIPEVIFIE